MTRNWDINQSNELYGIRNWGLGYFTINEQGHLCVRASADAPHKVDIKRLVDELRQRGIHPPILVRFMDILQDRMRRLVTCFRDAIVENEYKADYCPLFPIKVNQERDVVTSFLRYGKEMGVGLEAGSKAELMIVLALTQFKDTPIVCNGYKDPEFVRLVCMAHKIGKKIFPVLENYGELETFIRSYKESGVMPRLGLRIKLATRGEGKWAATGGDTSKFGLRIPEVVRVIQRLKEENLLHCLKMVHFHIGSMVHKIKVVKNAILETMRVYTEMTQLGAELEYLDIGGGLGVDYDGSGPESSLNYSLEEYANDIIYRVKQLCDEHGIPHPTIFSESGRFLAAHYSMLVTDVPATNSVTSNGWEIEEPEQKYGPVKEMYEILGSLTEQNVAECYHDAAQYRSETLNLFRLGYLSLPDRANVEQIFWKIMAEIWKRREHLGPDEVTELELQLADTYFANFSLFQSLPDSWAIDQLFPVIPIHRLDEEPRNNAVIVDLTCDSDGLISTYIGGDDARSVPLHDVRPDEPYYIGVFLVGAYQETLGELHNLFGDPHAVQVEISGENHYKVRNFIKGDTVHEVISYVSYSPEKLLSTMRSQIERAVEEQSITIGESARLMQYFEDGLRGYTYFED